MVLSSKMWTSRLLCSLPVVLALVTIMSINISFASSENPDGKEIDTPHQPEIQPPTDLDLEGKCSAEIKRFCTENGETRLDCITKELKSEQAGKKPEAGNRVSKGCKQEWRELKVRLYKDLALTGKIQTACEQDIKQICGDDIHKGGALGCLRESKEKLSPNCQNEVFVAEEDAVYDFKLDPLLSQQCSSDAEKFCKDVPPGEGRIQTCLRNHAEQISILCNNELFRQETENAGDLRLNVVLYQACLNDKNKFCPGVLPGNSRVKECLESNRLDSHFSSTCKKEFDNILARRSADFRLNPVLNEKCAKDINMICQSAVEDVEQTPGETPRVINCLQDYKDDLATDCKKEVHKLLTLEAEDLRFSKELSELCKASKQKFCNHVDNDKVIPCLQRKFAELDGVCHAALFKLEQTLSSDIDYKYAMKKACGTEIKMLCNLQQHDRGAIIDCLQQNVDHQDMGDECKREVIADELESAKDYRLNYQIYKHCQDDVKTLCPRTKLCNVSETCGGQVLKCLQDKVDSLTSEDCKKGVFSFELKEAKNIELDIPLQTACQDNLKKFCPRRRGDHSRSLSCLRAHRNNLTLGCKDEELRFSMMEVSDIRLTPSLMNACGPELSYFCRDISPTNGKAFKCLQLHLSEIGMGVPCKSSVNLQEARQASDYRLDVRVRTGCKDDVGKLCSNVDKNEEGHAAVLKCFVDQYKKLSSNCQSEVAYAVRMALWQYKFDSNLTVPCDDTVKKFCSESEVKPVNDTVIGTYGQCLSTLRKKKINPSCRALIRVATAEGSFLDSNSNSADLAAINAKIAELKNGGDSSHSGIGFFWVTTVVAFVALLAVALFRRYSGPPKTYTLVVKGGDL